MSDGRAAWADALLAARLFAADPQQLGGIRLRARPGPARDRWLAALREELGNRFSVRTLPANIAPDRLLGGLDLGATLSSGKPVAQAGLLAEADGGVVIVPMAERMAPHIVSALIAAIDMGEIAVERDGVSLRVPARVGVVLIDEGEDGDAPPVAIVERLGLASSLDGISIRDLDQNEPRTSAIESVEDPASILCEVAQAFGIDSARAAILALSTARASAKLNGRTQPDMGDVEVAARLCLAPRATRLPELPPERADAPDHPSDALDGESETGPLADRIVEAVAAVLPDDVLAGLERASARSRQSGRGSGAARKSQMRGRPIGARAGKPGANARLHLIETLRAAAPWQKLRRGEGGKVQIRASDFRIRRFAERSESTLIFAVDASGSAAAERMAEAKGAIELLLAEAYVKRTQVALVGFRGERAEFLLPPTRSLVRAKRQLAEMAGGGGTPLAAGIEAAQALAEDARSRGRAPFVVMMTDGRANVSRDGSAGRALAEAEALTAARRMAASGIKSVVIDVAARPRDEARSLAAAMSADYAALPRADARSLSGIVGTLTA